jgi:D-alanyl-D-alanine carboxypeptidase
LSVEALFGRRRIAGCCVLAAAFCWALFLWPDSAEARRRAHGAHHHHHQAHHVSSHPAAAMVIDGRTGKTLHTNNIDTLRHPASLTKIMTLYLLFEQLRAGKMTMDTALKVSEKAADQAPSKLDLREGETISVKDAIKALVTKSANDVAVVVAENVGGSEAAFAKMMTDKARALGMSHSVFRNASGLPNEEHHTTARDMITLAQHTLKQFPQYSQVFQTRFFQYKGRVHRNHNGLLFSYPGAEGMKTGYTEAAGFNLVITARRSGKHLIAVVLGGKSSFARNQAMRELLDAAWPSAVVAGGKAVEPVMASAEAPPASAPAAISRSLPVMAATAAETTSEPTEIPETPEPNPAFHSTPEEQRLKAQILAAINGSPSGAGRGGLPITAVLAGASNDAPEAATPAEAPVAQEAAKEAQEDAAGEAQEVPSQEAPTQEIAVQETAVQKTAVQETAVQAAPAMQAAPAQPAPVQTSAAAPAPEQAAAGPGKATQVAAVEQRAAPAAPKAPAQHGPYHVQVGSYPDEAGAQHRIAEVMAAAAKVVKGHPAFTATGQISGKDVYRARYGSFSEKEADSACSVIKKQKLDCMVVRAD